MHSSAVRPAVTPSAKPQWRPFFIPLPALQAQREQEERGSISRATAEAMAAEATAAVAARVAAGGSSSGLSWRRGGSIDYGGCAIDWEAEEVGNARRPTFTAATGSVDIAAEGRGPASPLPLAGHFIVCGAEVRVGSWGLWGGELGAVGRARGSGCGVGSWGLWGGPEAQAVGWGVAGCGEGKRRRL